MSLLFCSYIYTKKKIKIKLNEIIWLRKKDINGCSYLLIVIFINELNKKKKKMMKIIFEILTIIMRFVCVCGLVIIFEADETNIHILIT